MTALPFIPELETESAGALPAPGTSSSFPKLERLHAAEQAIERHDYETAVAALEGGHPGAAEFPELALRALLAESWARMSLGELDAALTLLDRARALTERPSFDDVDRAEVLYRLACCRLGLSQVANAVSLLTLALELCDRSSRGPDRLRARILDWRSRCYQRQRDWDAARSDVELGLEVARSIGDSHTTACLYFQASIIAEREGQWLLARFYGEHALELYERCGDRLATHKLLNNLGGIHFLLEDHAQARTCLLDALAIAEELESDLGAAYAISSLAQVQLKSGAADEAETNALRALELLGGRTDHLAEIGNAQLVLGRSLLEQERLAEADELFRAAEASFDRLDSDSHRAAAWMAQGDLAARRGDVAGAARLYRSAAECLQDFNF
jgi:tetratricopeptide (TPR) repeat protein